MRGGVGAPSDDKVSKAVEDMIGAKIVDSGFIKEVNEGGLAFDYVKEGEKVVKRLVLGYNELGEWVKYQGSEEDFIGKKNCKD